jgi:hypothetical protein
MKFLIIMLKISCSFGIFKTLFLSKMSLKLPEPASVAQGWSVASVPVPMTGLKKRYKRSDEF